MSAPEKSPMRSAAVGTVDVHVEVGHPQVVAHREVDQACADHAVTVVRREELHVEVRVLGRQRDAGDLPGGEGVDRPVALEYRNPAVLASLPGQAVSLAPNDHAELTVEVPQR